MGAFGFSLLANISPLFSLSLSLSPAPSAPKIRNLKKKQKKKEKEKNSMATTTVDVPAPSSGRLSLESIPAVDLRFLTQSELTALSQCSAFSFDLRRCDDVVVPKIDRSVFNESAGSRKQTYSRLRLAPRKPDVSTSKPRPPPSPPDDPERAENTRIISLFKHLFNSASNGGELVAVDFRYSQGFPVKSDLDASGGERFFSGETRKRGRKPKGDKPEADVVFGGENKNKSLVLYDDNAQAREKEMLNKNGAVVNLDQLAALEDPYGLEITRRTVGLNGDQQLLGFISRLPGQWGSRRKRRRIVDANEFGDALPNGWKILIGMKKKQGLAWLFCRRYVSPNGRYFLSCKEVSTYLRSLYGLQDGLATSNMCSQVSQMENRVALVEAAPTKAINASASAISLPVSNDHEKQITLVKDVGSSKDATVFTCHKCSTPFYQKNGLLNHLLSCHKRKRRKAGMPLDDFELMRAGPYDCQFCNKIFYERNVFFAHVGLHVKNYLKSIGESGEGADSEKENSPVPLREIHPSGSEMKWPMDGAMINSDVKGKELGASHNTGAKQTKFCIESHSQSADCATTNLSVDGEQSTGAFGVELVDESSSDQGGKSPLGLNNDLGSVDSVGDYALAELGSVCRTENEEPIDKNINTCGATVEAKSSMITTGIENSVQEEDDLLISDDRSTSTMNVDHAISQDLEANCIELKEIMPKCESLDDKSNEVSASENSGARSLDNNFTKVKSDGELKPLDFDTVMHGSTIDEESREVNGEGRSLQERELTNMSETAVESGSEPCSFKPDNQQCFNTQDLAKKASQSSSQEANLTALNFKKNENNSHVNCVVAETKVSLGMYLFPGKESSSPIESAADTVSGGLLLKPRNDVSFNMPIPTGIGQIEPIHGTENIMTKVSTAKESKPEELIHPSGLFHSRVSLDENMLDNDGLEKISASWSHSVAGSGVLPSESHAYGTCDSVLDEPSQERAPESVLSSLSPSKHTRAVSGELCGNKSVLNELASVRSTIHHPELGKLENHEANKTIFGFGSGVSEINTGILPANIPESSSAFSLWNNHQTYGIGNDQSRVSGTREESRPEGLSQANVLSLAGFQQPCDVGYNLNESYSMGTVDNFSRLNTLERPGDSNQGVSSETLWRNSESNVLPNGLADSASEQSQVSGAFQSFNFLPEKGDGDVFSMNEKFDGMPSFNGLRSGTMEPMEFSFFTPQDSSAQLEDPKVLSYDNEGMEQGFDTSLWMGRDNAMLNLSGPPPIRTVMCVWCQREFQLESIDADVESGSIGYLCPACK